MRRAFAEAVRNAAEIDERIALLVGDIGFGLFDQFRSSFPRRFLNMGIAEQNMIGVAAGMAKEGAIPFVYTIIPFLLMRPFEHIRVDLGMHRRKVALVGVGEGLSYDVLGPTHHALEDIAIASAVPGMEIYTPASKAAVETAVRNWLDQGEGPAYFRLGRDASDLSSDAESNGGTASFTALSYSAKGSSLAVVSYGSVSSDAEEAVKIVNADGPQVGSVVLHRLAPLPTDLLAEALGDVKTVLVVEEHYAHNGLFGRLCASELRDTYRFRSLAVPERYVSRVASRGELHREFELDARGIIERLKLELDASGD